jgi:hypothetical protein
MGSGVHARRGLGSVARVIELVTAALVGLIVLGIVLVLLEANRANDLVDLILDGGGFFVDPFDDVFTLDRHKTNVLVNWGLAALIYGALGGLIVRLLRR